MNGDGIINIHDLALAGKNDVIPSGNYGPLQEGSTIMSVDPETIVVNHGENFSININVTGALATWAFEFKLGWNSSMLNITYVNYNSFLRSGGEVYCAQDIHYDEGWILFGCTLLEPATSQSGDGDLAIINFTTLSAGDTTLHLYDTYLLDDNLENYAHEKRDGTVSVAPKTCGISANPSNIEFGIVEPGNISLEKTITLNNTGITETTSLTIKGIDWSATSYTMPVGQTHWYLTSGTDYESMSALTTSETPLGQQANPGVPLPVYFKLKIPEGQYQGNYNQNITFTGGC